MVGNVLIQIALTAMAFHWSFFLPQLSSAKKQHFQVFHYASKAYFQPACIKYQAMLPPKTEVPISALFQQNQQFIQQILLKII